VDRETALARKRIADVETAIQQEQDDMRSAETLGLTTRMPEKTFEELLSANRDSLGYLASSDDGEDWEDDDDDEEHSEPGKLSDNDERGWGMGTITKPVQYHMERFRQMQMRLDELTQLG